MLSTLSACSYFITLEEPPVDDLSGQNLSISYFDSRVFESTFRHIIASQPDSLTVNVANSFKLNDLPDVFQEWIDACSSRGGEIKLVNLEDKPRMRGIGETIAKQVFEYFYDKYKADQKEKWYDPISNYNIEIVHSKTDGVVHSLVFTHK